MSNECNCPICRFCRKELSVSEMAWYLKGSIEKQGKYLKLIKEAKSLEDLKESVRFDGYDYDGDCLLLEDLKCNKDKNPNNWWDSAMDNPQDFA